MNKIWTKEEIEFLTQNYTVLGPAKCAKELGRGTASIRVKACRLGLTDSKPGPKAKTHEWYEEQLLRKESEAYPIEKYINNKTPIKHTCINNHVWSAPPETILKGAGCPVCAGVETKTHAQYLQDLLDKNIQYKPLEEYVNSRTKILHECSEGHIWSSNPNSILNGKGCPTCSKKGFDPSKPAILYYIKFTDGISTYYKIGITNRSVRERFTSADLSKATILLESYYILGSKARLEEQRILEEFKQYRSHCDFISSGNTECFETDVLQLDN